MFPGTIMYYPANISIGVNVFINRGVFITAPAAVRIGDAALIGPYVVLNSGNHRFASCNRRIRDQGHDVAPITIGNDAWLGAHVTVVAGVEIGDGAVVGAGSVVTRNVDPGSIVAGVPSRRIGERRVD